MIKTKLNRKQLYSNKIDLVHKYNNNLQDNFLKTITKNHFKSIYPNSCHIRRQFHYNCP